MGGWVDGWMGGSQQRTLLVFPFGDEASDLAGGKLGLFAHEWEGGAHEGKGGRDDSGNVRGHRSRRRLEGGALLFCGVVGG